MSGTPPPVIGTVTNGVPRDDLEAYGPINASQPSTAVQTQSKYTNPNNPLAIKESDVPISKGRADTINAEGRTAGQSDIATILIMENMAVGPIAPTLVCETEDFGNKRPTSRDEVATLQELLGPSRRFFTKVCGRLAPTTPLSQSYRTQIAKLEDAFRQKWVQSYGDLYTPKFPVLGPQRCTIMGLKAPTGSVPPILQFDAEVDSHIAIVVRYCARSQMAFFEPGSQIPTMGISNRVQKANAHCLFRRRQLFKERPSFANATVAQKYCLSIMHAEWMRNKDGIETEAVVFPPSSQQPEEVGHPYVNRLLRDRADDYFKWVRTFGRDLYRMGKCAVDCPCQYDANSNCCVDWQTEMTWQEFGEWIAPIAFATSVYDLEHALKSRIPVQQGFLGPVAEASGVVAHPMKDIDPVAFTRSDTLKGIDRFRHSMTYDPREYRDLSRLRRGNHRGRRELEPGTEAFALANNGLPYARRDPHGSVADGGVDDGSLASGASVDVGQLSPPSSEEDADPGDADGEDRKGNATIEKRPIVDVLAGLSGGEEDSAAKRLRFSSMEDPRGLRKMRPILKIRRVLPLPRSAPQ